VAFDFNTLVLVGGTRPGALVYTYTTNDTQSTVMAIGYFNSGFTRLAVNDLITVVNNEGVFDIRVIALAKSSVTVSLIISSTTLDGEIKDDTIAAITKTVLTGKYNDEYMNVPVDASGRLLVTQEKGTHLTLLNEILIQLKIMNTYNSLAHDEVIKEDDTNED